MGPQHLKTALHGGQSTSRPSNWAVSPRRAIFFWADRCDRLDSPQPTHAAIFATRNAYIPLASQLQSKAPFTTGDTRSFESAIATMWHAPRRNYSNRCAAETAKMSRNKTRGESMSASLLALKKRIALRPRATFSTWNRFFLAVCTAALLLARANAFAADPAPAAPAAPVKAGPAAPADNAAPKESAPGVSSDAAPAVRRCGRAS